MWGLLVGIAIVAAPGEVPDVYSQVLPVARRVTGMVVDVAGRPIRGARIEYLFEQRTGVATDATGAFSVVTRAPTLIVRQTGYWSGVIRVRESEDVTITMRPVGQPLPHEGCRDTSNYSSIRDRGALIWFPNTDGVRIFEGKRYAGYGSREYLPESSQPGRGEGLVHGSGEITDAGLPGRADVWNSVAYEEAVFLVEFVRYVDARGTTTDGKRWRHFGRVGESASYRGVDETTAKLLDQVMDGACILLQGQHQ